MKLLFSSKYKVCWKSIEIEVVFTKMEMNYEMKREFSSKYKVLEKYWNWSFIYLYING